MASPPPEVVFLGQSCWPPVELQSNILLKWFYMVYKWRWTCDHSCGEEYSVSLTQYKGGAMTKHYVRGAGEGQHGR